MVNQLPSTATVMEWLDAIPDPELPAVTITDLGIVRDVHWSGTTLVVALTPTYSGCPATKAIEADVMAELQLHGVERVTVETRLAPAWTTDWITPRGRERMLEYGIVPPQHPAAAELALGPIASTIVPCPRCNARATTQLSRFGSTPCKALYRCEMCHEPFDYIKPY